nr:MAG TPA: hypothetical protein [Caudoviricetes sp.]
MPTTLSGGPCFPLCPRSPPAFSGHNMQAHSI